MNDSTHNWISTNTTHHHHHQPPPTTTNHHHHHHQGHVAELFKAAGGRHVQVDRDPSEKSKVVHNRSPEEPEALMEVWCFPTVHIIWEIEASAVAIHMYYVKLSENEGPCEAGKIEPSCRQ